MEGRKKLNKVRRTALLEIIYKLEDIRDEVESLKDEEKEYFENMPDGLKKGDKGEAAKEAVYDLEDIYEDIDIAINKIREVIL